MVSVLMPVYNAERYVDDAVQSILDQTYTDFELMIIDDGSTDGSLQILKRRAEMDDRVNLVSRENIGLVGTRSELLESARGVYLACMDADDISFPTRFEKQVAYLEEHPRCVAIGTRVELIDSRGRRLRPWLTAIDHEEIDALHLDGQGGAVVHPSVMMRAAVVRELGGYRSHLPPAEDFDLFLRLAEKGRVENIDEILVQYRQHLHSQGYANRKLQKTNMLLSIEDACERRGIPFNPPAEDSLPVRIRKVDHYRKWAWWALGAGEIATARYYAFASLVRTPMSVAAWRLAACAIRGR